MKITIVSLIVLLTMPNMISAESRHDFGKFWKALDPYERRLYLEGHNHGMSNYYTEAIHIFDKDNDKSKTIKMTKLLLEYYIGDANIDMTVMCDVITDLYNDPANTYIEYFYMIPIAREKIQGKSIEDKLLQARRLAQSRINFLIQMQEEHKTKSE